MPSKDPQQVRHIGEVRIRSNVCMTPSEWHLVPGEMLGEDVKLVGRTEKQRQEAMYYAPCSLCNRTICDINEDGCDNYTCLKQGTPSTAEAQRRKLACATDEDDECQ